MSENNQILSVEGQLVGIPVQEYTAGPGIVVDNVNKVIRVDETVLWEGTKADSCLLSEDTNNFEKIGVFLENQNGDIEEQIIVPKGSSYTFATIGATLGPNNAGIVFRFITVTSTSMTVTKGKTMYMSYNDSGTSWSADTSATNNKDALVKIVGIGRKESA